MSPIAVLGAGLNAWLVLAVWPWLFEPRPGPPASVAAALALGALVLGAGNLKRHPGPAMAAWLLAFPVLLGGSLATLPPDNRTASMGVVPMALGVLGLWGHAGTSVWAWQRLQATTLLPHGALPPAVSPAQERASAGSWARAASVALLAVGAFAIGVLAPLWGGHQELVARWGDAADEGALLTATVAAALGAATAGPFLAALLRPRVPSTPRPDLALKVASLLLLALLGAVSYRVL